MKITIILIFLIALISSVFTRVHKPRISKRAKRFFKKVGKGLKKFSKVALNVGAKLAGTFGGPQGKLLGKAMRMGSKLIRDKRR